VAGRLTKFREAFYPTEIVNTEVKLLGLVKIEEKIFRFIVN
jgi:hypothetical protein